LNTSENVREQALIGSTAVVVDSASYLPAHVHERYGLRTVPLTVVVDGDEYREFVDMGAAEFYERVAGGAEVSSSQPAPGLFVEAYEAAAEAGARDIASIHIGSGMSGTVNSARLAAAMVDVPVRVIDTGQASFIEGLCVWAFCEALSECATLDEAEERALAAGANSGNVFIVGGLALLERGGRFRSEGATSPVPVLAVRDDVVSPIGSANTVEEAMIAMTGHVAAAIEANPGKSFRIGVSNGAADELANDLEARLSAFDAVDEICQYTIGPVVGTHTGPGCVGAVFLPRDPS
jgi:fatty acid kinase fatty acid binding subunit